MNCNKKYMYKNMPKFLRVMVMVINDIFNNIPVTSWQSVLLVEETEVPKKKLPTYHKSLRKKEEFRLKYGIKY